MTADERIAVLEAKLERNEVDITKLFDFIREHMDREEKDRELFLRELSDIRGTIKNQKSFVGGMIFTISAIWIVGSAIVLWFFGR